MKFDTYSTIKTGLSPFVLTHIIIGYDHHIVETSNPMPNNRYPTHNELEAVLYYNGNFDTFIFNADDKLASTQYFNNDDNNNSNHDNIDHANISNDDYHLDVNHDNNDIDIFNVVQSGHVKNCEHDFSYLKMSHEHSEIHIESTYNGKCVTTRLQIKNEGNIDKKINDNSDLSYILSSIIKKLSNSVHTLQDICCEDMRR